MHEHVTAQKLVESAIKSAGSNKIKKLIIECGELSDIPIKDLKFAIEHSLEHRNINAEVELIETKAVAICPKCHFEGEPKIEMHSHDANIYFCKNCKAVPKLTKGNEINLKKIIVD